MHGNEEINAAVWEWFLAARAKDNPLSEPMLRTEAPEVAKKLNNTKFRASTGWLDSFKARHKISFNQISGEAKGVDEVTVTDWNEKLKFLIAD